VRSSGEKKTNKKREEEGDIQPDYTSNSGVFHVSAVYVGGVREATRGWDSGGVAEFELTPGYCDYRKELISAPLA
jgi:hypothetical protein